MSIPKNLLMNTFLDLVNNPYSLWTIFLILLLTAIGSKMVESRPRLRLAGHRIATAALIGYGLYGIHELQPSDAEALVGIVLRGLIAFGLTLGAAWIVLAANGFVYQHTFQRLCNTMRHSARCRAHERCEEQWRLQKIEAERRSQHELEMERMNQPPPSSPIPAEQQLESAEKRLDERLQIIERLPLSDQEKQRAAQVAVRKFEEEVEQILYPSP